MSVTTLDAYLGVPMPSIEPFERADEKGKSRTVLYANLDDLADCSGKLEFPFGDSTVNPTFRLLEDEGREAIARDRIFPKKLLKECEIVVISATVPLSSYQDVSCSGEFDQADIARLLARAEFGKYVSDLLVMANVARVGGIELRRSVVVQDGDRQEFSEIPRMDGHSLQDAANVAEQMSWPPLLQLDIQTVWRWLMRHCPMIEGFDGGPVSRALAAFSRLFEHKTADEPMQLLWALVGVEALYVKGKSEVARQVREKAQVLLGPQQEFKKKLTKMYDFRSRFVHGNLDFPGLLLMRDASEAVGRYDVELLEAIAVAIALLAATLQEVIRRDWAGLQFGYTVSDSEMAPTERDAEPGRGAV